MCDATIFSWSGHAGSTTDYHQCELSTSLTSRELSSRPPLDYILSVGVNEACSDSSIRSLATLSFTRSCKYEFSLFHLSIMEGM